MNVVHQLPRRRVYRIDLSREQQDLPDWRQARAIRIEYSTTSLRSLATRLGR